MDPVMHIKKKIIRNIAVINEKLENIIFKKLLLSSRTNPTISCTKKRFFAESLKISSIKPIQVKGNEMMKIFRFKIIPKIKPIIEKRIPPPVGIPFL